MMHVYSYEQILERPCYKRDDIIDQQVETHYQQSWCHIEKILSANNACHPAILPETLVDLHLIWMRMGRYKDAEKALMYLVEKHLKLYTCKACANLVHCSDDRADFAEDVLEHILKNLTLVGTNNNKSTSFIRCNFYITIKLIIIKVRKKWYHHKSHCLNATDISPLEPSDQETNSLQNIPDSSPSPEGIAISNLRVAEIFQLLTDEEQHVLLLLMDGLNQKQIATQIGKTDRTVRNIIERIKRKIR